MTRDEIMSIPAGATMDALVAEKVMGWVPWLEKRGDYTYWVWQKPGEREPWNTHRDAEAHRARYEPATTFDPHNHIMSFLPKFSTYIAAAWDIVEKMRDRYECEIGVKRLSPLGIDKYSCTIRGGSLWYRDPDLKLIIVANTAPLAICRASLLAKMTNEG